MFSSNVAPSRRMKPPSKDTWTCPECGRVNQPFIVICLRPGCREVRPKPSAD